MNTITKNKVIDIYIEDRGYGAIVALTPMAKYALYAEGFDNELLYNMRSYPDRKICQPGHGEGEYELECGLGEVQKYIEYFENLGLKIESDF
jgi:hypothetical protein